MVRGLQPVRNSKGASGFLLAPCTFSLVAQFVIMLPQLGNQLGTLQLNLWVRRQVVGRQRFLYHGVSLHIQVPIDAGGAGKRERVSVYMWWGGRS